MLRRLRRILALGIDAAVGTWSRRHGQLRVPVSIFHGPVSYEEDGIVASQVPTFMEDERFRRALQCAEAAGKMTGPWRIYICCWLADMVRGLDGDFVECGVNMGGYSRAVIDYIDFDRLDKTFYLLDTFNGLDHSLVTEAELAHGIDHYFGGYRDVFERAKETFKAFRVVLIRGSIPGTLAQCPSERIAYLSIDMNCVAPEVAALHYFWPKVVKGGVVILDDHAFPRHVEQRRAHEDFAALVGARILVLPTGQGIIIK